MRNFSTTSSEWSFLSSNCNDEYLTGDPVEVHFEVLRALARAFESRFEDVLSEWAHAPNEEHELVRKLAPSEFAVLIELWKFYQVAEKRFDDYCGSNQPVLTFVYVNLNTGSSVTWSSIVN